MAQTVSYIDVIGETFTYLGIEERAVCRQEEDPEVLLKVRLDSVGKVHLNEKMS